MEVAGSRAARIVVLNGTSSAGKTTLARALRPHLPSNFCFFASDQLEDPALGELRFRPREPEVRLRTRELFFHGFHRAVAAFAAAGNDLLVEHIVERAEWGEELRALLTPFDCFWVGVHAAADEVDRRELLRGNRTVGEGREHAGTHAFCRYDVEVDTGRPVHEVVERIMTAWRKRAGGGGAWEQ